MFGKMMTFGLMLSAYDQMSSVVMSASNKSIASLDRMQQKIKSISDSSERFGRAAMARGVVAAGSMLAPLKAYADQEEAITNLQVAMMQKGGAVSPVFEGLKKQIVDLGNRLPGTTADYADLATTMTSLGIPAEKLLGGALDAAANLRVVLKMTSESAGETVVKLREAYNLTDNDLAKTADIAQRAKYAFGMKPEDLRVAASYQAAQLNILHLGGAENMKKMLVMQGMANLKGVEGSSFGTNMAMMLQRLATGPQMLEKAKKGMKGVGKDILEDLGLTFDFFDKMGNFRGLEAMVKEFEKFKIIEAKYGQKGVSTVSNALFGIEAARPAMILAEYGEAGYKAAMKRFEEQADLQERITKILGTGKNVWEAFTGTVTNFMAAFGGPVVNALKPFVNTLNEITGGPLMTWADQHQKLCAVVGLSVLGVGLLSIGLGVLGLVAGTAGKLIFGGVTAIGGLAKASRFAIGWLVAHRMEILRLMGVQRAQIALQNMQNYVAYRGGVWKALEYSLLTARLRMLSAIAAGWAWVGVSLAWTRANLLSIAGLRALAVSFAGSLVNGIKTATVAVRAFTLTLLANPITWVALAIGAAAFVIYKYWRPISGFFKGLWQGIKEGLQGMEPAWAVFTKVGTFLSPVLAPLKWIWDALKNILKPVDDVGGAAEKMGVRWGKVIGGMLTSVLNLPAKLFTAGANIIDSLWRGMMSTIDKPVDAMKSMVQKLRNHLPFSPAKEGPLKDIHRIRLVETIAQSIKAAPMVKAMRMATAATMLAAAPVTGGPALAHGGGNGQAAITFAPVINITAASSPEEVRKQVDQALQFSQAEFEKMLARAERNKERKRFAA